MELMFADEDLNIKKPASKKQKKGGKKVTIATPGLGDTNPSII